MKFYSEISLTQMIIISHCNSPLNEFNTIKRNILCNASSKLQNTYIYSAPGLLIPLIWLGIDSNSFWTSFRGNVSHSSGKTSSSTLRWWKISTSSLLIQDTPQMFDYIKIRRLCWNQFKCCISLCSLFIVITPSSTLTRNGSTG